MNVIAVDPGFEKSAVVEYDGQRIVGMWLEENEDIMRFLQHRALDQDSKPLVIEQIQSYGMAVGATVFETVFWSGRFAQAWERGMNQFYRLPRREVKLHLCGQARAKDANIRQALIDRFGPGKEAAIGRKATPGPLYGVKSDLWAALAVAVTWADQNTILEES